jgi:hypothetical protein
MKMNIRKANHDRKEIDSQLRELKSDIGSGRRSVIAYYRKMNPMFGSLTVEDMSKEITATWQKINDLIKRREQLNKAVMMANATTMITVPKFVDMTAISTETEQITLAGAIARKKYYASVLMDLANTIDSRIDTIELHYNRDTNDFNNALKAQVNQQFNAESAQAAKARIEYEETLRPQYELAWLNPIDAKTKIRTAIEAINKYLSDIDSLISNATETTEVEVED